MMSLPVHGTGRPVAEFADPVERPVRCLFLKGKSVHDELGCLDIRPDII